MNMNFVSVRIQKLKLNNLKSVGNHNSRSIKDNSRIDYSKSKNNECVHGENKNIYDHVLDRINKFKVKIKGSGTTHESTAAIEMVISASPEFFRNNALDWGEYDSKKVEKWVEINIKTLKEKYGSNFVRADLHLDEATPHLHAVITPLVKVEKKKRRTKQQIANNEPAQTYTTASLNAKRMFDRAALIQLQTDMANPLKIMGLERGIHGSKTKHKKTKEYWKELITKVEKKIENFIPKINLNEKGMFQSEKSYLNQEENRLNQAIKSAFKSLIDLLNHYKTESKHYKHLYEQERAKTAHVRRNLGEEIDSFSIRYSKRHKTDQDQIKILSNQLEKVEKKVESLESENSTYQHLASRSATAIETLQDRINALKIDNKCLEIDLRRSNEQKNTFDY